MLHSPDRRMHDNPHRTPEADRRLDALDEVTREYQAAHAFVEGVTVFGSTMHGGAHEQSDVDAFMYIDPDVLADEMGGAEPDEHDRVQMARAVEHDVFERLGLDSASSGRRNDVQLYFVNDRIIDESLSRFEENEARSQEFREMSDTLRDAYWDHVDAAGGEDESFEDFARRSSGVDIDDEPEMAMVEWGIAALFHPAVGDRARIDTLRQKVLDRIASSPAGEQMWSNIASSIYGFEGDMHSEQAKFPATLAEATDMFGKHGK